MRYILLLVCVCGTIAAMAQDKKKTEKAPVYNYVLEDPMEGFSRQALGNTSYIYIPEFYAIKPYTDKDTTYTFTCYGSRDSVLPFFKINNITEVKFISLFKSYTDPVHTYKDADGKLQQLPVSSIIRRYDRVGDNKWMSINYATNKYEELKEYRTNIVRTDTVSIQDPITQAMSSSNFKTWNW